MKGWRKGTITIQETTTTRRISRQKRKSSKAKADDLTIEAKGSKAKADNLTTEAKGGKAKADNLRTEAKGGKARTEESKGRSEAATRDDAIGIMTKTTTMINEQG